MHRILGALIDSVIHIELQYIQAQVSYLGITTGGIIYTMTTVGTVCTKYINKQLNLW